MRAPVLRGLLVAAGLLAGGLSTASASAEAATLQDQGERLQALQSVRNVAPAVLGGLLSYVLGGVTVEARGTFAADVALDCPWLAAQVRTELSGAVQAHPSLAQAAVSWLKLNGPVGIAASLAASQLTPELLQRLATDAPQTLDQFLAWLGGQAPEVLGEVAQEVMGSAGSTVTDMLLVLARKYPRVAARAVGAVVRHCPALLPRVMRLLVQRGPAQTP